MNNPTLEQCSRGIQPCWFFQQRGCRQSVSSVCTVARGQSCGRYPCPLWIRGTVRLDGDIAFTMLLRRLPDMRLDTPQDAVTWKGNVFLHGISSLPVAF